MPKVSIILTAYNLEKYISRAINSILCQTFSDFELIIIEDGSSDETPKICDYYAKKDDRIRIHHQSNSGVSLARQKGIELAKGEYSIYVDADDYLDPQELELLYNVAVSHDADIVICNYWLEDKKHNFTLRNQKAEYTDSSLYFKEIIEGSKVGVLWNKLIKTSLYLKYNVQFPIHIYFCEDICALAQILPNHHTCYYIEKPLYYHCYNNKSITRKKSKNTITNKMYFIDFIENMFGKNHYNLNKIKIGIKIAMLKSCLFSFDEIRNIYTSIPISESKKYFDTKYILLLYFSSHKITFLITKFFLSTYFGIKTAYNFFYSIIKKTLLSK